MRSKDTSYSDRRYSRSPYGRRYSRSRSRSYERRGSPRGHRRSSRSRSRDREYAPRVREEYRRRSPENGYYEKERGNARCKSATLLFSRYSLRRYEFRAAFARLEIRYVWNGRLWLCFQCVVGNRCRVFAADCQIDVFLCHRHEVRTGRRHRGGSGARPPILNLWPPFHVWPPGCCIHLILFLKMCPPFGLQHPLLRNPGDGPEFLEPRNFRAHENGGLESWSKLSWGCFVCAVKNISRGLLCLFYLHHSLPWKIALRCSHLIV